jgi:hypothetical protein
MKTKQPLIALATAALLVISAAGSAQASPASQQQAVQSAKQYLGMGGFSRTGLIKQLEYEHFSEDDATYAVDNITVDWNQQAAKSAKQYLSMGGGFSHDGLVNQLTYEGFTESQAEYGASAAGL